MDTKATIKNKIESIFPELGKIGAAVETYRKTLADLEKLPFVEEEKARVRTREKEKFQNAVHAIAQPIGDSLDAIRTAATEQEQAFEITGELQAAIALVDATGDKLPGETRDNIWKPFIGSRQALVMLKALFEAKGLYTGELSKYIISADTWADRLERAATDAFINPADNIMQAYQFGKLLEEFAALEGVELGKGIADYLDYSTYMTQAIRDSSGLAI